MCIMFYERNCITAINTLFIRGIITLNKEKRKFKISANAVLNIIVAALTIYLIIYFCVSENGMIELLSTPDSFNLLWLIAAIVVYDLNIFIDAIVTLIFIRSQFKEFRFIDAVKVSLVGIFFGAVTPSSTGGQPMQLYLLSKMKVGVGFGSACMTQKFIIYQIVTTAFSIFSIIFCFRFFQEAFRGIWSSLFIILGFVSQMTITSLLLIISHSKKLTGKLINLVDRLIKKLKFIKNPEHKIEHIKAEVDTFHSANKMLFVNKKLMFATYVLIILQVLAILSAPFFIYYSLGMPEIAAESGCPVGSLFEFICIQSFVIFTSNLIPLPGASGGAELAFTMYFGPFFIIGSVNKIKPAILLWRFVSYYGTILISAPFSYLIKGKKKEEENQKDDVEKSV